MNNKSNGDFIKNNIVYQAVNPLSYAITEPSIDIATLCNCQLDKIKEIDSSINLSPYELSYNDFMACFYHQPGASFSINSANVAFKPLMLVGQSYKTINDNSFSWDLYNQCIKAYCEKNSVSETTISSFRKIALTKETIKVQSLASSLGTQIGLTWDMVLNNLQVNNKIEYTKDTEDFANVIFKVGYIYYSTSLDVTLEIFFSYKTSIPNYRNIYNTTNIDNAHISPYSKNEINLPQDDSDENILPHYTDISHLIEERIHKKDKKKDKKNFKHPETKISVSYNDIGDNDTVLTRHIVNSNHNNLDTNLVEETENDSGDDVAPW